MLRSSALPPPPPPFHIYFSHQLCEVSIQITLIWFRILFRNLVHRYTRVSRFYIQREKKKEQSRRAHFRTRCLTARVKKKKEKKENKRKCVAVIPAKPVLPNIWHGHQAWPRITMAGTCYHVTESCLGTSMITFTIADTQLKCAWFAGNGSQGTCWSFNLPRDNSIDLVNSSVLCWVHTNWGAAKWPWEQAELSWGPSTHSSR